MINKQIKINIINRKDLISKIMKPFNKNHKPTIFLYLNSGSYYYKTIQHEYEKAIIMADYIYLNSYYLGLLFKYFLHKHFEKINAEDFIFDLLRICDKQKKRVFVLGATNYTNLKAVKKIKNRYKKLTVSGFTGYFKKDLEALSRINSFRPHILIVGLGSGIQEPWILRNVKRINQPMSIVAVGNYIDILGNSRQLTPKFLRKLELEWLYRLIREPRRLWKRYFFGPFISLKDIILSEQPRNLQS